MMKWHVFLSARVLATLLAGLWLAGCANTAETESDPLAVRTLSDSEIEQLKAGGPPGMALAAELNGFPGPKHVLELQEELGITPDQRFQLTRLVSVTQGKARAMGKRILVAENEFDFFLSAGKQPMDAIRARLDKIAGLRAALRGIHIEAHMKTFAILDDGQLEKYRELRDLPPPPSEPEPVEKEVPQTPLY